ncbi:MAG: transposase [Candidatus Methanospirareceae archaeon]
MWSLAEAGLQRRIEYTRLSTKFPKNSLKISERECKGSSLQIFQRERRRHYTRNFKIGVVREVESGKPLAQVSRENGINPSLIVKWRKQYFDDPENAFRGLDGCMQRMSF